MTRLRPHDRSIRAVLQPEFPDGLTTRGTWPCSDCGARFDAASTRAVIYARPGQDVPYAFMVCPRCAQALTPLRLRLDQPRLRTLTSVTETADGTLRTARIVAEQMTCVLAMRREPPPDVVQLRAVDTQELADRLHTTQAHLVERLQALGVLAEPDIGDPKSEADPARSRRATR